jgi:hypothetical protein
MVGMAVAAASSLTGRPGYLAARSGMNSDSMSVVRRRPGGEPSATEKLSRPASYRPHSRQLGTDSCTYTDAIAGRDAMLDTELVSGLGAA